MSQSDADVNPGYKPLGRWEPEDEDGYQNVHVQELLMEDRLNVAVERIRQFIDFYDLRKGIKSDENAWSMRMKGYYQLLLALVRLEHEMDPDFAWYEKRMSFENGYGASIICKPVSNGGDAQMFEIAVLKNGKINYNTPVSYDVEGFLRFKDVVEVLHEIRELPPAEKDDVEEDDVEYEYIHPRWDRFHLRYEEDKQNGREDRRDERFKKYETEIAKKIADKVAKKNADEGSQGPEQEEANPYEVYKHVRESPTGPTSYAT